MEALGFIAIVVIAVAIIVKASLSENGKSSQSENAASYHREYPDSIQTQETVFHSPAIYDSPLMYPSTKGAISRMSEADRKAYYDAVEDIRRRIGEETVIVNDFAEPIIYAKHARVVLRKHLKEGDIKKARQAAMNLFYFLVCQAAGFSPSSYDLYSPWLPSHNIALMNLTYFRVGKITGRRGDEDLKDIWGKEYELISKALDPEKKVKISTNWRKIRDMAEGLAETASDTNGEGGNP